MKSFNALLSLIRGLTRSRVVKKAPTGHRAAPQHIQGQYITEAQAKRDRKNQARRATYHLQQKLGHHAH